MATYTTPGWATVPGGCLAVHDRTLGVPVTQGLVLLGRSETRESDDDPLGPIRRAIEFSLGALARGRYAEADATLFRVWGKLEEMRATGIPDPDRWAEHRAGCVYSFLEGPQHRRCRVVDGALCKMGLPLLERLAGGRHHHPAQLWEESPA